MLNNFSGDRSYGCRAILSHYSSSYERRRFGDALERGELIIDKEHLAASLQEHLFVPVGQHPDITFYVFLPPTSIWFRRWADHYFPAALRSFYDFRALLIAGASHYRNMRLFEYQSDSIILEPDWYSDLSHYSGAINDRIVLDMWRGLAPPAIGQQALEAQLTIKDRCHSDRFNRYESQ